MGSAGPTVDTVSTIADPSSLRALIPRLGAQPHWTDFATPDQIALYDPPEVAFPLVPRDKYSLQGFSPDLLGSAVPDDADVHPRLLFSPEDVPALRNRLAAAPPGQRYLAELEVTVNAYTCSKENEQFWELARGNPDGKLVAVPPNEGPNGNHVLSGQCRAKWMHSSHVPQIPFHLSNAALHCLLTDNAELGAAVGRAMVTYHLLREPFWDAHLALADNPAAENSWPADLWRGWNLVVGQIHIGLGYDFAAKWMGAEDKATMRRLIGKATRGRRAYGQNGPLRWRDTNWVGWDLEHNLCAMAIEGTQEYDSELYALAVETVEAYFSFGISPDGTILETNGKNDAGLLVAMTCGLVLARRGDNLFGHPHFRKLCESQMHQVTPTGDYNFNNGTYGCTEFRLPGHFLSLYPDNLSAAFLLRAQHPDDEEFDPNEYRQRLLEKTHTVPRLPWPEGCWGRGAHWGHALAKVNSLSVPRWSRDFVGLPLDFEDAHHGILASRSSNDSTALHLFMEARADKISVGHEHHDAGHFYLQADGVRWGVESDHGLRDSAVHSVVLVDGLGQGSVQHCSPARVKWLGAKIRETSAFASADLKHGYDYVWSSPMHYSWTNEERMSLQWEPEMLPEVVAAYKGTQHYKARKWMSDYWNWGWGPTMRALYNPVQYAFRSVGLVRGKHPYVVVVDDMRKDSGKHLFEWQMQTNKDAVLIANPRVLPAGLTLLARRQGLRPNGMPEKGAPCLGIYDIQPRTYAPPTDERSFRPRLEHFGGEHYRLVFPQYAEDPAFKFALVPFRFEEVMPRCELTSLPEGSTCSLSWHTGKEVRQSDLVRFGSAQNQTTCSIMRDGQCIASLD